MPKEISIPEIWDKLFAVDSLTLTLPSEYVPELKRNLTKYKSKEMAKFKGQIEVLRLEYKELPKSIEDDPLLNVVKLRIDLVKAGSSIPYFELEINDQDAEQF